MFYLFVKFESNFFFQKVPVPYPVEKHIPVPVEKVKHYPVHVHVPKVNKISTSQRSVTRLTMHLHPIALSS